MAEKPRKNQFTGYVLAGGRSSRMKRDKALLKIGGKTFLENAHDALAPNCKKVKIVLNRAQTNHIGKLSKETGYVFDIFQNRGAPGGIHAALADCETEFAVILAVDLPFVDHETIEKLCEIALSETDFSVFVPLQTNGKLQPLCAVYRTESCLPRLNEILSEHAAASVRDFLERVSSKIIEENILDGERRLFANINLPEEYETLC